LSHALQLGCRFAALQGLAQQDSNAAKTSVQQTPAERDGQHDFDPLIGSWKYHPKAPPASPNRLAYLVELDGTGVCFKVWDGRAELDAIDGPTGHIEGLTLRMYKPESHQWRLYWANGKNGIVDPPQIGSFLTLNRLQYVKAGWGELSHHLPRCSSSSVVILALYGSVRKDLPNPSSSAFRNPQRATIHRHCLKGLAVAIGAGSESRPGGNGLAGDQYVAFRPCGFFQFSEPLRSYACPARLHFYLFHG
jgi:hypothetical protein